MTKTLIVLVYTLQLFQCVPNYFALFCIQHPFLQKYPFIQTQLYFKMVVHIFCIFVSRTLLESWFTQTELTRFLSFTSLKNVISMPLELINLLNRIEQSNVWPLHYKLISISVNQNSVWNSIKTNHSILNYIMVVQKFTMRVYFSCFNLIYIF